MLIEAHRLARRYGAGHAAVDALREASFAIAEGEFVAIMGPSGSGKSTLMHLIGLLDRPTSGRLSLLGEDTTRLGHDALALMRNRRIGFLFQAYNLLPRSTTAENVELPLLYSGLGRTERRLKARAALEAVGLAHRAEHWPSELSGGEQQRAAIARALIGDPTLILADEPTGALDSKTGLRILAVFQALNRAGRTIVMVTHDGHVAHHARRILRLQDGEIVGDERVAAPSDATLHRAVAAA
jgi:putative ABC transport system ATP-binding protein